MIMKLETTQAEGFSSSEIFSTMNSLSDMFQASCAISSAAHGIQAGLPCQIFVDDEKIITGNIDKVRVSSREKTITWTGRDKTRNLIDSSPKVQTGEWKNSTTKEIISDVASEFGISVEGENGRLFTQYNTSVSTKCSEIIAELCSVSGILATSTSDGNIVLAKAEPVASDIILEEDRNIEEFEMIADDSNSYQEYKILGQQTFINGNDQISATAPFAVATGSSVASRYLTVISPVSTDFASAQVQVNWLRDEKEADRETLSVTVAGRVDVRPNTIISRVLIPSLRIDSKRLIEAILWKYSEGTGNTTTFFLVNPSKYGGAAEEFTGWLS